MNYTIEIAKLHEPAVESALRKVIKAAFNTPDMVPEGHLAKNISSHASQPSFFLVAIENNEIIGCNGFIANDFLLNGKQYVGYQSCWSATHPEHQGKKVFVNIINEAKKILKEQGAGFLYGIPNNTSHPIFIKKLGFSETPAMLSRVLNIPLWSSIYLASQKAGSENGCTINEKQVKDHKTIQHPASIGSIEYNDSLLWGKLSKKKKFGISIPFFEVGGIRLENEIDLKIMVKQVFKLYKPWFLQFISCRSNTFNATLKKWKPASMNGFIYYNLNMPEFEHFNVMLGAIDVF